jgi:DNA-directed RNA polymerase subunit RPC12/RpoP
MEMTNDTKIRLYLLDSTTPDEVATGANPGIPECECTWGEFFETNKEAMSLEELEEQKQDLATYGRHMSVGYVGLIIRIDLVEQLPTTGKYEHKDYKCSRCGHVKSAGTNHYGEFYDRCPECSWKNPMDSTVTWVCLAPLPATHIKPAPWKKVRLGDICEIVRGTYVPNALADQM